MMISSADFLRKLRVRDRPGCRGHCRKRSCQPSAVISTSIESGVAGQRLVHAVVDHFRKQVMQRLLIGAADIHAGTAPHRLQTLPAPRCVWRE